MDITFDQVFAFYLGIIGGLIFFIPVVALFRILWKLVDDD